MLWGQKWAYGQFDVITDTDKLVTNATALESSPIKDVDHPIDVGSTAITSEIVRDQDKVIDSGSTSISSSIYRVTLMDAAGYFYVFIGGSTNASDRPGTAYTNPSDPSSIWTEVSSQSTSWS